MLRMRILILHKKKGNRLTSVLSLLARIISAKLGQLLNRVCLHTKETKLTAQVCERCNTEACLFLNSKPSAFCAESDRK